MVPFDVVFVSEVSEFSFVAGRVALGCVVFLVVGVVFVKLDIVILEYNFVSVDGWAPVVTFVIVF